MLIKIKPKAIVDKIEKASIVFLRLLLVPRIIETKKISGENYLSVKKQFVIA